jgi:hypothetical protein
MMDLVKFGHYNGGASAACLSLIITNAVFGDVITDLGVQLCAAGALIMFIVFMICPEYPERGDA